MSGYSPLPPPWRSPLPDDIEAALPRKRRGQSRSQRERDEHGAARRLPRWQLGVLALVAVAIFLRLLLAPGAF